MRGEVLIEGYGGVELYAAAVAATGQQVGQSPVSGALRGAKVSQAGEHGEVFPQVLQEGEVLGHDVVSTGGGRVPLPGIHAVGVVHPHKAAGKGGVLAWGSGSKAFHPR